MAVRAGGRGAQTRFWVRERFGDWTLVEALLLTGRTHQLRVHFASIGHPWPATRPMARSARCRACERQFLHAHLLRLRSPHDGQEHTFEAELPPICDTLDGCAARALERANAAAPNASNVKLP